jgi:hypothetical protein
MSHENHENFRSCCIFKACLPSLGYKTSSLRSQSDSLHYNPNILPSEFSVASKKHVSCSDPQYSIPFLMKDLPCGTSTESNMTSLSLGMILSKAIIHPSLDEDPFEPRPIHPSLLVRNEVEATIVDFCYPATEAHTTVMDSTYRKPESPRRMSVQLILEVLNDLPTIRDTDENSFPPAITIPVVARDRDELPFLVDITTPIFEDEGTASEVQDDVVAFEPIMVMPDSNARNVVVDDSNIIATADEKTCSPTPEQMIVTSQGPEWQDKNVDASEHDDEVLFDAFVSAASISRLQRIMSKSRYTQSLLQDWDKKNGLPRSHCCTMMHTNRSRRQLEEGRILPKWNGAPLIKKMKRCTYEDSDKERVPSSTLSLSQLSHRKRKKKRIN